MPVEQVTLSADHEALLELLRTRGLSVKGMDERKKEEFRRFLDYLCNERGMSLNDVAKLIGNKTSGYSSWLCRQLGVTVRPFEEARLKGIKEKRRKYERRPFDGSDEDKAYMLGLRHGDLSVSRPWNNAIRVSTSTTHPAMAELFHALFEPYGHVYQHPRYKKDTRTFEWNLSAILDESFDFLFQEFSDALVWLSKRGSVRLSYLAGFLDAEGSIVTTRDSRGTVSIFLDYYNSNRRLLDWVRSSIESMGQRCSLRLNKREGTRTKKYGIFHRKDYYQLSAFGVQRVQPLIKALPLRHREKVSKKELALSVRAGDEFSKYQLRVLELRTRIKQEVASFVQEAERTFLKSHPGFGTE